MKVSSRIPSINVQNSSAEENQGNEKPGKTKSVTTGFPLDAFERDHSQSESIPDFPIGRHRSSGSALFGDIASAIGFPPEPENSRGSRVNKYEGPNSLPLRGSKVDHYKGPDSIELPKSESPVSNYQGPDSIRPPRPRPHVDLTVPGKTKNGYPQAEQPSPLDILRGGGRPSSGLLASAIGFSSDPENSQPGTRVEKYKGPKSLFDEQDSRGKK
ncbi:MAG TPA: hypothetical protein VH815_16225 [Acidobacteriota bacterium]